MTKPSLLFWIIAVLAVLWNAFGVYDYWMTSTGNADYLKDYDPRLIEWMTAFPLWRKALWAISVALGVLGALALLLRRRVAVALLVLHFVVMVLGFAGYDILIANGAQIYGQLGLAMSAVLVLVAGGIWLYADRAAKNGYLV